VDAHRVDLLAAVALLVTPGMRLRVRIMIKGNQSVATPSASNNVYQPPAAYLSPFAFSFTFAVTQTRRRF
jgi:hypothetical protein